MSSASRQRPEPDAAAGNRSVTAPLFVWLGLQLLALLLSAVGVSFWGDFPRPPERVALQELLGVQIIAAALLYPFLLRDWQTFIWLMLTAAPFVLLAAFLSGTPYASASLAYIYLLTWLAALRMWAALLRTPVARQLGIASASGLTLGGPMLYYINLEFRGENPLPLLSTFGPLLSAISISRGNVMLISGWVWTCAPLLIGASLLIAGRLRLRFRRRTLAAPSYPQ